jgi:hypothetical protein
MNHIAPRRVASLAFLSPDLARMVEDRASPDKDTRDRAKRYGRPPTQAESAEAWQAYEANDRAMWPVSEQALVEWASPINSAVRNPQSREDFLTRLEAWAQAFADMPAACFNAQTQREAMQAFKFWPSVSEVFDLLKPHRDAMEATQAALKELAQIAAQPEPALAKPRSVKVCEDVAAGFRALKEEMGPLPRPEPVQPKHFTPHPPLRTVEQQLAALRGET